MLQNKFYFVSTYFFIPYLHLERNYFKTDKFIEPKTITRGASFTRLDKRRAFRVLLGKAGRKKRLIKSGTRWEDNI